MPDKGYNGYKNYETWAVALWIDNEEPLYRERLDRIFYTLEDASANYETECTVKSVVTIEDYARHRVADMLKDWIGEMSPDLGASLWADLLNAAISEVDWNELAEHWIPESREDD